MALTKCRECENEVSTEAIACPHCGAPYPARQEWKGFGFEWKSNVTCWGYPLVHVAFGRDAQRKLRVAKGIIAIGQFGVGAITIAQFGIGILFGFGQFAIGLTVVAQFAVGLLFGGGQFAAGYIAIRQFALGYYALAQMGFAEHLWSVARRDPQAVEFFRHLAEKMGGL